MKKGSYLLAMLLPFSLSVNAGGEVVEEIIEIEEEESWFNPVIALSGGVAVAAVGDSQSFYSLHNNTLYLFDVHKQRQRHGTWGVFLGNALYGDDGREMHWGFAYYELSNKRVEGTLSEITPSMLSQYGYQYDLTGRQVLFELKLAKLVTRRVHPYFEAGAGWSFNQANNFSTNVYGVNFAAPMFEDNRNSSFTYRFGIGLDVDIISYVRLGLGYRFISWGKADLGTGVIPMVGLPLPRTLTQDNVYSNGGEVQLTLSF